ncbi:MAG: sensor histidine kinase [Thermoanaerobacteraceae bacterium]|nr:sensor histidine kinase [Thermoanaerobacteraceae bacterium]
MDFIQSFFTADNGVVFLIYGQVYFLIGFAVLVKNVRHSDFGWSRDIKLFALFAIAHGLALWAAAGFLPCRGACPADVHFVLFASGYGLFTLSYVFLFVFGLKVAFSRKVNWPVHLVIPAVVLGTWLAGALLLRPNIPDIHQWIVAASALSRYLIALPAGLISAYAFFRQAADYERVGITRLTRAMRLGAIFLAVYGLLTGVIAPKANFFPASVLNYETFFQITGMSVLVFRLAFGIGMSFNIIRSLELFDVEQRRRVEEAEKKEAVMKERERISREIHDGTIQSLYGIGLRLELAQSLLDERAPAALKEHIDYAVEHLGRTITDIRAYIMNLRHRYFRETSLRVDLQGLVQEFRVTTDMVPEYVYREEATLSLSTEQRTHLYYIVREALNNIRKHARATRVWLEVTVRAKQVEVVVKDNGKGFTVEESVKWGRHGLRNMQERVKELDGSMEIDSEPGKGTTITITVPMGGQANE